MVSNPSIYFNGLKMFGDISCFAVNNSQDEILELVPYMGYIKSCVIQLFTLNREREAVWGNEENGRFGARILRFQASQCHHLVVWLWTSRFYMDLSFFPFGKMTGWARFFCLMSKAAMQHSVTNF